MTRFLNYRHLLLIAALLAGAGIAAASVWWSGSQADRVRARSVRQALDAGRLDQAEAALDAWLSDWPRSAEAHFLRAQVAWARSDLSRVHDELIEARNLGYPAPPLVRLRGLLLARLNQADQAEPLLHQTIEGTPQVDPDVADALTRIYLGGFRLKRAADLLERWIRDWPEDARAYYLRAQIAARNEESVEKVIDDYRATLQRDPNLHAARLELADLLRKNHRNTEATAEYALYLKHRPDDSLAHLGAGQNALEQGDLEQARFHLERAGSLTPDDPVILGARAALEIRQKRFDEALGHLDRAVAIDPFDLGNRYQRMVVLQQQGKKDLADAERQTWERLRDEQKEFADLANRLKQEPLNVQLRSQAARWLMDHGHAAEAVDWARLVLRSSPSDPAMNRLLADYYRQTGQTGLANFHEIHAGPPAHKHPPAPPP